MDGNEGMLDRSLRILEAFTEDRPELSASELTAITRLPASTVHRIVSALVRGGLISRTPGRRYAVGSRLWELGELSPLALRLRETALPHMARLYEATGENVHLAVLDGPAPQTSTALFVGRVSGHSSIATISRMGGRQPLHTTGVGKALLSTRDEDWLGAYFQSPLIPETTHSVTEEAMLRADLRRAHRRGYATTREEMTLGNVSIAAALAPVAGLPPVAMGIVVHVERSDERRLAPIVVRTAQDLHRALVRS